MPRHRPPRPDPNVKIDLDAYAAGMKAAMQGKHFLDNPYAEFSQGWDSGWLDTKPHGLISAEAHSSAKYPV